MRVRSTILTVMILLLAADIAAAQAPFWNRKLDDVALTRNAASATYDLFIPVEIQVSNPGTIFDLSTAMQVSLNGTPVASFTWEVVTNNPTQSCTLNCGSDCGPLRVDGVINTMTCHEDSDGDCQCSHWLTAEVPGLDLEPDDIIFIQLDAGPGALPDEITADNDFRLIFEGEPVGWDRRLAGVAIQENDGGHDIEVLVDLRADGLSSDLNLSTEVVLQVNGEPAEPGLPGVIIFLDSNGLNGSCEFDCGTGCGGMYVDGVFNTMTCRLDGPGDCDCGYWLQANFPGVELMPEDEIMVLLRPAPGAVPEADPTGDRQFITFTGLETGWGRSLQSVSVTPSPVGENFFDVFVVVDLDAEGLFRGVDLSSRVQLRVEGLEIQDLVTQVFAGPTGLDCEFNCGSNCGPMYIDGVFNAMTCRLDGPGDCDCGYWLTAGAQGVELQPGDEITVLLQPAPGAAPDAAAVDGVDFLVWQRGLSSELPAWVRSLTDIDVLSDGTAGNIVHVEGAVAIGNPNRFLDLSFEAVLELDGVMVASQEQPFVYRPSAGLDLCQPDCSDGTCGIFAGAVGESFPAGCGEWPGFDDCVCGAAFDLTFTGIPVTPGAVLAVILRPAPGALPELPGFDEEHYLEWAPTTAVDDEVPAAATVLLEQNQPNPFNPQTVIRYSTAVTGPVRLEIYDTRGTQVRRLVDEEKPAGRWSVTWDGRDDRGRALASGHYFYRLTAGNALLTRKMTLLR